MSSHARPSARPRLVAPLVLVAALVGGLFALSTPGTAVTDDEGLLASLVNGARAGAGLPPLSVSGALSDVARSRSASMASAGSISHSGNLAGVVGSVVADWTAVGENVAVSDSVAGAHAAIMGSSAHRANVLGDFNVLGVGVVRSSDGRVWVTELFAKAATATVEPQPQPQPVVVQEPVDTTVVAPALMAQPEPVVVEATAPAPGPAAKVRAAAKPAPTQKKQRPARAPRPAAAAPMDEGSCLPEQARPQGQGHAYGRCDDVPRGQGAAGRRP